MGMEVMRWILPGNPGGLKILGLGAAVFKGESAQCRCCSLALTCLEAGLRLCKLLRPPAALSNLLRSTGEMGHFLNAAGALNNPAPFGLLATAEASN